MRTVRASKAAALGTGLLLASLLAVGGSSSVASAATKGTTASNTSAGSGGGGSVPAASGSVAAITGSSMEVQSQQTGQVTVSWTASTAFSKTVTMSAADVVVGDCVTVTGSTSTGKLVANAITVSTPTSSGSCATGRTGTGIPSGGGGFPGRNSPNSGTRPTSGSLPKLPSGSSSGSPTAFGFASGKVTSVSSSRLVIKGVSSSGFGQARRGKQSSKPPASQKTTSVKIGLQKSTAFSGTHSTAASSLAVGDCVTAVGSTDSTGAVTARTIHITSTGGKSCSGGFPGFGGGASNG